MGSSNNAFGTYLLPASGPPIYFDCVTAEQVTRDSETTEFPVEVGANITDHYRVKMNEVRLEVFVSQEPINQLLHPEGSGFFGAQTLNTPAYPSQSSLLSAVKTVVNPVGAVIGAIGGLLDGAQRPVVATLLQYPSPFDSLESLLRALDALRTNATLTQVVMRSAVYSSMVIGHVVTSRDKETGTGTKVSIELKQIATVSTQQVAAPTPVFPKDAPPVNKGAQMPQPPGQTQSLASALVGLIAGGP